MYQDKTIINETKLIIRQEYYPNTKNLRSKGFFINGKRDSIWKTYDKHGKIIEETVYKMELPWEVGNEITRRTA